MQKELLEKAIRIDREINRLKNMKEILSKHSCVFGYSILKMGIPQCFHPIKIESLDDEFIEMTKAYCDAKLIELEKEFDKL